MTFKPGLTCVLLPKHTLWTGWLQVDGDHAITQAVTSQLYLCSLRGKTSLVPYTLISRQCSLAFGEHALKS